MAFDDEPVLPRIGQWYADAQDGRFKVVAIEDGGGIEVQYLDGDVGGFDPEEWLASDLKRTAAPEDWTDALEPIEDGDAGYDEESFDASRPRLPGVEDGNVLLPDEGQVHKARGTPGRREH
jgi:hypothetical protein